MTLGMSRYILDGRVPVPEPDLTRWAEWFEQANNRRVDVTRVGDVEISTVFLGLDHGFLEFCRDDGPPILFETMVFGGRLDGEQERYSTFDRAEQGHALMCARVRASLDP